MKRPGPGGDGWNDEDDEPRAIDKKLRIEEASVDDGWTSNITLPPNRRFLINRTGNKQNVADLSELRLVMLFLDDGVLSHIVIETNQNYLVKFETDPEKHKSAWTELTFDK